MANMQFKYSSGTFSLVTNPFPYDQYTLDMADSRRAVSGGLVKYPKANYEVFELTFQNIGTADFTNLKTLFDTHASFTFLPFDEIRGTAVSYVVAWQGDFRFKFVDNFFNSGFQGFIQLEEV